MNTEILKTLDSDDIISIDFDLIPETDFYALTTIRREQGRCRVFYCFRDDDTRDEGEDRCTDDDFKSIYTSLVSILADNDNGTEPSSVTHKLVITSSNRNTLTIENTLSGNILREVISLLADHITDFGFLQAFRAYVF